MRADEGKVCGLQTEQQALTAFFFEDIVKHDGTWSMCLSIERTASGTHAPRQARELIRSTKTEGAWRIVLVQELPTLGVPLTASLLQ